MIARIREFREDLIDLQAKVNCLIEEPSISYRELDIISQKLEEAIMWTYRVVALEKESEMEEVKKISDNDVELLKKVLGIK